MINDGSRWKDLENIAARFSKPKGDAVVEQYKAQQYAVVATMPLSGTRVFGPYNEADANTAAEKIRQQQVSQDSTQFRVQTFVHQMEEYRP